MQQVTAYKSRVKICRSGLSKTVGLLYILYQFILNGCLVGSLFGVCAGIGLLTELAERGDSQDRNDALVHLKRMVRNDSVVDSLQ